MFIFKVYPCNIVVFLIALNCLKLLILKGYLHFFCEKNIVAGKVIKLYRSGEDLLDSLANFILSQSPSWDTTRQLGTKEAYEDQDKFSAKLKSIPEILFANNLFLLKTKLLNESRQTQETARTLSL